MAMTTVWWALAGAAIVLELMTGTFYLLMLALGLAVGALAAHAGLASSMQFLLAALVGGGAVAAWRWFKLKQTPSAPAQANPDVNMDVGATVLVQHWRADGTASVKYRGAQWEVSHRPGEAAQAGAHRIVEVVGSRLIVEKSPS